MNNIRCFLFDLDGTLLDSRDPIIDAMFATVQRYLTHRVTRDELLGRFGESFDDFYQQIADLITGNVTREQVFHTYLEFMNLHHNGPLIFFPYVREGLEQLKSLGYQIGIVTNKQRKFVLKGLKQSGILNLFDTIICVDDVTAGKPSPEPIVKAMDSLGVRPNQTMMVGDSRYDMISARAAQVKCVLLEWYGQNKSQELLPDYCFSSFREFLENIYLHEKSAG
jgi:pyrophosphatase PpaX